jgi:hypothetical protein
MAHALNESGIRLKFGGIVLVGRTGYACACQERGGQQKASRSVGFHLSVLLLR